MAAGYRSGLLTGLAVSGAAALLAPLWRPLMARWARPATKAVLKGGLLAVEAGRERVSEMSEAFSDVLAEAQYEIGAERGTPEAPATGDATGAPAEG